MFNIVNTIAILLICGAAFAALSIGNAHFLLFIIAMLFDYESSSLLIIPFGMAASVAEIFIIERLFVIFGRRDTKYQLSHNAGLYRDLLSISLDGAIERIRGAGLFGNAYIVVKNDDGETVKLETQYLSINITNIKVGDSVVKDSYDTTCHINGVKELFLCAPKDK